ncbi:hypothetical protein J6590_063766 [Homalodisca vitripennis]|nr:hypothetical protein J6590_063766 [Homalodisca vitripennis]
MFTNSVVVSLKCMTPSELQVGPPLLCRQSGLVSPLYRSTIIPALQGRSGRGHCLYLSVAYRLACVGESRKARARMPPSCCLNTIRGRPMGGGLGKPRPSVAHAQSHGPGPPSPASSLSSLLSTRQHHSVILVYCLCVLQS